MSKLESVQVKATLPVPLSTEEMKKYADEAANLMAELDEAEEEYKGVQREWRNKLKDLRLSMRKFLRAYKDQAEEREVDCVQFFDLEAKETWYEYDGEMHKRRALDEYEVARAKQGALFGDGANLPANATVEHSNPDDNDEDGSWDPDDSEAPSLEAVQ